MVRNTEYLDQVTTLIRSPYSNYQLNELKETFREKIGSNRSLQRCGSLPELVKLLQKRDILNDEETQELRTVAQILNRMDVLNNRIIPSGRSNNNIRINQVVPNMSFEVYDRITDVIGRDIGYKWKEFARKLNVREGEIDNLEMKYRDVSDRVRVMLDNFRENCPRHTFQFDLLNALRNARRRDLSLQVETIISNASLAY